MIVQTHSISILSVALIVFLVAAVTHSRTLAAAPQNAAQKESASVKSVEATVSRLLAVPIYTVSDEELLNEAGDSAAVAITKAVSPPEMNSGETGRRIVLILHLAFEAPQSITEASNRSANTALHLLNQLERTDFGRGQPNAIANARREIEHNSSTGKPLEFVTFPGEPVVDWGHTEWIQNVLAWTSTIKSGMTRTDLLRVFTSEGGLSTRTHQTYVLKQCPVIKVDVEFSVSGDQTKDKIAKISRPYLAYTSADWFSANPRCCGRDDHRWSPPAQNRTSGFPAYGSHLGGLTRGATTRTPPNPWNTLSPHCVE